MVVNEYIQAVEKARLMLLCTVVDNVEVSEDLTEIALLLKSEVTTHNAEKLVRIVSKYEEGK